MLKIDSMQQLDHEGHRIDEELRLSNNDQMQLRASPPASMVDIPGKLNQEQSKVSIISNGQHGFIQAQETDKLKASPNQNDTDDKDKMVSSLGAEMDKGGIFQNKLAMSASLDADQIEDAKDNDKQVEEKGDHTANRYQDQQDDE